MFQIFRELDTFDLKRGVNIRTIKYGHFDNSQYMGNSMVYTSVCNEMIRLAHDYWLSGIRYSNYEMKSVFVDFGGGFGKPAILASETNKFDFVFSVDIDAELIAECNNNFSKIGLKGERLQSIIANVEDDSLNALFSKINDLIGDSNYTIFVFNKNSYGSSVLEKSLSKLRELGPTNQIYLYQNPVHSDVLIQEKFRIIAQDEFASNKHKNYKYKIYWR